MEVTAVVCLFWIFVQRVYSVQDSLGDTQIVDVTDVDVDFERLENEYAVGNVSMVTEAYENVTAPEIFTVSTAEMPQAQSDNVTEFKPSVHLGEIDEFRSVDSNPFNKLNHLKFDNFFSVQQEAENWNNLQPRKNETNPFKEINNNNNINLTPSEINFFPKLIVNENQYLTTHYNEDSFHHPLPPFYGQILFPTAYQNSLQPPPILQRPEFPSKSPDKTFFETTYVQEIPQPFNHPGSLLDEANYVTPFNDAQNFEYIKQPEFQNYEEPNGAKFHPEIHEITPTRNHGFPYKFYHDTPNFMDSNLEYVTEKQVFHNFPRERRMSPWKKLIHLIGTILPFGLLLATLSPNIIQISNATQSTIPLSKLKDVDLPPEHKSFRMADDPSYCEEKNVCQVILAGSKPRSNLLQNVLWNFVVRTPEETAKDNGLRELFKAVKKRDCNLITC